MSLTNPVADVSQGVLTIPGKVLSVDTSGNAMTAAPHDASVDGVATTSIQETALGVYNGTTVDRVRSAGAGDAQTTGVPLHAQGAYNGASIDRVRIITKFVQIKAQAVTASTPVDVYTPTTGKKFRLLAYDLGLSVAGSVLIEDGTGTEVLRTGTRPANGGAYAALGNGILSGAINTHIFIDVTASGTVNGWIGICEE